MTTVDNSLLARLLDTLPADDRLTRALAVPETVARVSAVLATYNRCPFEPITDRGNNPLAWALETLVDQLGNALAEIVVVDDGSTDHTQAVLDHYTTVAQIPVRTVRLERHCGTAAARNAGISVAEGEWLLFGDDDCIYPPHYAEGAAYAMHLLQQRDEATAVVGLPFYYRALRPRETLPVEQIGRLDPHAAAFATRFHTIPAEYLPDPPRLDLRSGLLAPLKVSLIGGTALVDAEALRRVGGFADLSTWSTSYSDHLHLSADLTDCGRHLYYCPDPRLGAAHLKFGAAGQFPLHSDDLATPVRALGRTFADLVRLSAVPRSGTGCRVADSDFHEEMIGSFFAFFAGRSLASGVVWGVRTWREFVEHGEIYSLSVATAPSRPEREIAWRNGLARGARFLTSTARPSRDHASVSQVLERISTEIGAGNLSQWTGSGG